MGYLKRGSSHFKAKDQKYYETYPVTRANFKKVCETQGWNYKAFEEIESGEWYFSPCKTFNRKKYFYKRKEV